MDDDRKYKQHGYQESTPKADSPRNDAPREHFPPRHAMDITAPRTPRMVRAVTATRCYNCTATIPEGFNFAEPCPKCQSQLHCCKQCSFFDSAAHFQCTKPIPERIAYKDRQNECEFFSPRVTVARDSSTPQSMLPPSIPAESKPSAPRHVSDARAAFESLFKKD